MLQFLLMIILIYSAYLKIGEGCDNRCSYCAIPIIRGHFVSRDYDSVIKEAKELAEAGIKEIIVLEQDTTKYGIDFKDKKVREKCGVLACFCMNLPLISAYLSEKHVDAVFCDAPVGGIKRHVRSTR